MIDIKWESLRERIGTSPVMGYKPGQPIVVFCAGDRGKFAMRTLRDRGLNVVAFCDDDQKKWGTEFYNLPVVPSYAVEDMKPDPFVVVAVETTEKQEAILKRLDFMQLDAASVGDFVYPEVMDRIDAVYHSLADEQSKEVLYHVLLAHYEQDKRHFQPVFEDRQYWCMGFLAHDDDHVFVDAGAYTGDTMEDFVRRTHGKFHEIISFEPTESLYKNVVERKYFLMDRWQLKEYQITPIFGGIGEFDAKMPLIIKDSDANGAGNSFYDIAERTGDMVNVHSLDSYMGGDRVTFIKADIEGFELEMLKGAENTIQIWRPDLAICVYHKTSDIYEIPEYVKSIVPEYKLYLRHHHDDYSETVLYASVL